MKNFKTFLSEKLSKSLAEASRLPRRGRFRINDNPPGGNGFDDIFGGVGGMGGGPMRGADRINVNNSTTDFLLISPSSLHGRINNMKKPSWFEGSDEAWGDIIRDLLMDLPILSAELGDLTLEMMHSIVMWMGSNSGSPTVSSLLELLQMPSSSGGLFSNYLGGVSSLFQINQVDGVIQINLNTIVTNDLNLETYFDINNISPDEQAIINGVNAIFEFINDLAIPVSNP
tara:strand:+ start:332 stop:1018 length:687 start_codon:yes stop_codon:yes gene_type:complete